MLTRRPRPAGRPLVALALLAVALVAGAASARAADVWTRPYPGVEHLFRTTGTPNRIHVLKIDLSRAGIPVPV